MMIKIAKIVFFTLLISKSAFSKVDAAAFDLSFYGTQNDGTHKCALFQRDGKVTVNYEINLGTTRAHSKWTEVEKTYSLNEAFKAGSKILIQDRTSKIEINTLNSSAKSYKVTHGKTHYFKSISCANK